MTIQKLSLFTKFTLLMLFATVAGVAITISMLYVNMVMIRRNMPTGDFISNMDRLIISQLNLNDKSATMSYLQTINLRMRYISTGFEWSTSDDVPTLEIVRKLSNGKPTFWLHGQLISMASVSGSTYIFQRVDPFKPVHFPWKIALAWSGAMVLLFSAMHFVVRRLLKPLHTLHRGVLQAGRGDFAINLPRTTKDELGLLIDSFNTMAGKVQRDIKSRDQLLRDISHELRSPLSRMMVAIEFIPPGNIHQILKNNIVSLDKMTQSILEEERIDSPYGNIKCEQIDLESMLKELVDAKSLLQQPIVLRSQELVTIPADRERIRMALSNVIDNACKYSKDEKPVEISYVKDGTTAIITITDYGIGIPESDIPFIFEPFYRVDKARKHSAGGYGLGMSLTKKIINAHHGTITMSSVVNFRTTFVITLPLFAEA